MLTHFRPRQIRKITVALLDMWNDMVVHRYASDQITITNTIDVPINFGAISKIFIERKEDRTSNDLNEKDRYYLTLPRMALALKSMSYVKDYAKSVNDFRYFAPTSGTFDSYSEYTTSVEPVPYKIVYELQIKAQYIEDLTQILENILPYFNPSLTLRMKEMDDLNEEREVRVDLVDVDLDIPEEIVEKERFELGATLTLDAYGVFYRPTSTAKIIKKIETTFNLGTLDLNTSAISEIHLSGFEALSAVPVGLSYDYSAALSGAPRDGYYFVDWLNNS